MAPEAAVAEAAPTLEERWGVEVVALRLTGANYMLDFRYKVLNPEKAAELFERANKPVLIHHSDRSQTRGAAAGQDRPAAARPTRPRPDGSISCCFSNPGVVHAGDEVTIKIGDFEADVIVE